MTYRRCICHPDDLPGVGISSGWVTANSLCHPDDILFHFMSSGWLNWGWFLIRMSYGNVIMSSGWDTLPFLSHPDEIANFDFPQHAVALQRFRNTEALKGHRVVWKIEIYYLIRMTYEWNSMSSGWHNNIVVTHPDEIPISAKSSGWHMVVWYVIRMTYCSVQKSSGWDTARN